MDGPNSGLEINPTQRFVRRRETFYDYCYLRAFSWRQWRLRIFSTYRPFELVHLLEFIWVNLETHLVSCGVS